MAIKVHNINGKNFVIYPNMTVERFGDLSDYFDQMIDSSGNISIESIKKFVTDSKKMTELMDLALKPVTEYGFFARILGQKRRKMKDLKHITLDQFVDVIMDFFGLSGPLQTAFLTALSQMVELQQTPLTNSAQK